MSTFTSAVGENAPPVCLRKENSNSLVSLWWIMHRSDDASRQTAVVTCYLDESGTHEKAPIAVVGGLLLNKERFGEFDEAWPKLLEKHSIQPPLHMSEFMRPDGRLAHISNAERELLFKDVVDAINTHKLYSIAAVVNTDQYKQYFDSAFRNKAMGVYGSCFMLCALMNHRLAKQNNYNERISFLMDSENRFADHVRGAHATMQEEKWKRIQVGSLTFDKDELWSPLQAADVIAWASRVRVQSGYFDNGFEPLIKLFDAAHAQESYLESAMAQLAAILDDLSQKGEFSLS